VSSVYHNARPAGECKLVKELLDYGLRCREIKIDLVLCGMVEELD